MRATSDGHPVINAAEEMDRLIAFHSSVPALHHRLPFLRAARAKQLSVCEIGRGGIPEWREVEQLAARLPMLILIGDDDHESSGPSGFPGLRRMQYWRPRKVVVHGSGASETISREIVAAIQVLRRMVLVETDSAHIDEWDAWAEALKPSHSILTVRPHVSSRHPDPAKAH